MKGAIWTITEIEVRKESVNDSKGWGIDPTYNKKHEEFWEKAIDQAVHGSKQDTVASKWVPSYSQPKRKFCKTFEYSPPSFHRKDSKCTTESMWGVLY